MNISSLFNKIMGFLIIIITLALAPTINTANAAIVGHANVSIMIGMSVIGGFGAPLIILGLLAAGGAFALAGVRGQMDASTSDLMSVVGSTIVVIVALTFMSTIITYVATLMGVYAATAFAYTLFSIIPLVVYLGIVAGAGWKTVSTYRARKGGKKSKKSGR